MPREPSAWKKPAGGGAGQMSAGAGAGVGDVDAQRVTAADRSSRASGLIGGSRCQLVCGGHSPHKVNIINENTFTLELMVAFHRARQPRPTRRYA